MEIAPALFYSVSYKDLIEFILEYLQNTTASSPKVILFSFYCMIEATDAA